MNWPNSWNTFLSENPSFQINLDNSSFSLPDKSPKDLAGDETFWNKVLNIYPSSDIISLNNGAVSSNPLLVQNAFTHLYEVMNSSPSYYILKVMEKGREVIRQGLASLINSSPDEVAILRNATEALNNVIFGLDLKEGDEVIACKQDYAKAVISWKQREKRDKIKVVWINLEGEPESNEEIINKYVSAITPKTKLLQLTHVINWNGQVMPVEEIIREAKKRNIPVLLDGAHSFALLETDMKKLDCDFFVTALHKWLNGPIPSAMLFVKKDKIKNLWPLASAVDPTSDNIRKFEELSIQLMPNILGLGFAMELHLRIGRENKEERLRYLRRYWTEKLKGHTGIRFRTPWEEKRNCIIVNLWFPDQDPATIEKKLFDDYRIHATTILWENMKGVRITPNIYTKTQDLDKLTEALKQLIKN